MELKKLKDLEQDYIMTLIFLNGNTEAKKGKMTARQHKK